MNALQKSFAAGLDLLSSVTQISSSGYEWLINGRNRFGPIQPILKHKKFVNAPEGDKQGCIAVGNVLIIFVGGKAYYMADSTPDVWVQIPGFQMSATAEQLWPVSIPASTFSFVRKLNPNGSIYDPIVAGNDVKIAGTPQSILVQDGINQPWIIEYDTTNQIFSARVTGTYNDWSNTGTSLNSREYVPIGTFMAYIAPKLLIVSVDQTAVYHSISGRPLDFMVNVDVDGNKLSIESLGGASTVAYGFDFNVITCLKPISIPDAFIVGTKDTCRMVQFDYSNTVFGEPKYIITSVINAGIVNNQSFIEGLNSYAFVDFDDVKTLDAVQQLKIRSSNDIFSKMISAALLNQDTLQPLKQTRTAAFAFDNYLLFNLDTFYGNVMFIYDDLCGCWCSIDITECTEVLQFAMIDTEARNKLFCVTRLGDVFELFGDTETDVPFLKTRSFVPDQTNTEHKSQSLALLFDHGTFSGTVIAREYVDRQEKIVDFNIQNLGEQELISAISGVDYPVRPPVIPSNSKQTQEVSFPMRQGEIGKSISFIISWDTDARLLEYQFISEETESDSNSTQKAAVFA